MTNSEFYNKNHILLFEPYDGIEFIYNILGNIGFVDYTRIGARKKGLETIKKLFETDLIHIFHWGNYQKEFKEEVFTIPEIIMHLRTVWFEGADFSDFISMPMFKYNDWYIKALEEEGLTHTTDWKWFVENKIGNLEQWIEEKRPKK